MPLNSQQTAIIKQAFNSVGVPYVEPTQVTVYDLFNTKSKIGKHRGLYYISPNLNFYFGKASGDKASIEARFQPHYSKLKVAINKFFQYMPKAAWSFPAGWREGVRRFLLDPTSILPEPGTPGFDPYAAFEPAFRNGVDVDNMEVVIWDLSHLKPSQISAIEKAVIRGPLQPFCNTETHRARRKSIN